MSREIKFRVWCPDDNHFTYFKLSELFGKTLPDLDDATFQEFTGLKDINNQDIYEGDLIIEQFSTNDNPNSSIDYKEWSNKKGEVVWDDYEHRWGVSYNNSNFTNHLDLGEKTSNIKIVGNICEDTG